MTFHVGLQCWRPNKCCIAHITFKRTFARVGAHVVTQVAVSCESNIANRTLIRFDSFMNPHVDFKVTSLSERLTTFFTFERLKALMRANVYFQSASSWVSLRTVRTLVRKLASVDQLVCLQVTSCYKHFTATIEIADKRTFPSLKKHTKWAKNVEFVLYILLTWILKWVFRLPVSTNWRLQFRKGQIMGILRSFLDL